MEIDTFSNSSISRTRLLTSTGSKLGFSWPAKVSNFAHDFSGANRHGFDSLDAVVYRAILGEIRQQQFRVRQNAAQQIIEVVRDTSGQYAEAFQFLRRQSLLLVALELGDVDHGSDMAGVFRTRKARNRRAEHPAEFAIGAALAELHLILALGSHRTPITTDQHPLPVIGMHQVQSSRVPSAVRSCGRWYIERLLVDVSHLASLVVRPDQDRRAIGDLRKPRFALGQ